MAPNILSVMTKAGPAYHASARVPTPVARKTTTRIIDPYAGTPYAGLSAQIGTILSPAEIATKSAAFGSTSIADQLKAYNALDAVAQKRYADQARSAEEYAKALGLISAPNPDAIKNAYMEAARVQQGLGTGLTGAVADAQQAAADKTAADVAQMTGGLGDARPTYDPAALRNIAMLTGVTMPAGNLADQAAQEYALAAYQRQANVHQVGDIAQQYLLKARDAEQAAAADRAKILATRPDLVAKESQLLSTNRQNQLTTSVNLGTAVANYKNQQATNARLQQQADAYDAYINGKLGVSRADLAWRKKYEGQQVVLKRQAQAEKAAADAAMAAYRQGELTAQQYKNELTAANYYVNPKTGKLAPIPSGTYIGKDGNPHRVAGASAAATAAKPKLHELTALTKAMTDGGMNKFVPPLDPPVIWPRKQVENWLMQQYGNDFLATFPGQKKIIQQKIHTVAGSILEAALAKQKRQRRK